MAGGAGDTLFGVFFAVWLVLAAVGFYMFQVRRDAAFKRRYFRWYLVLGAALFLVFMLVVGAPVQFLALALPMLALITYLNLRMTRFCDSCGRTAYGPFFAAPRFCPHCGSPLRP